MAVSGLNSSMMRAYAEHSVESRKDTQTLIDSQDDRAIAGAMTEVFLKDRANQEHMRKQLFETVKAGVKAAQATMKVGETANKAGEQKQVEQDLTKAVESGDLEQIKAVKIDDEHTVGDLLSDEEIRQLTTAPNERGEAPSTAEQVGRLQSQANPELQGLKDAIESGDMDRIKDADISEHSKLGDTMSDAKMRRLLTAPGDDGQPPSVDEQASRLLSAARQNEVTPKQIRDNILGELDRVASDILTKRSADDRQAAGGMAKDKSEAKSERSALYASKTQDAQDFALVGRLAADANTPLVG